MLIKLHVVQTLCRSNLMWLIRWQSMYLKWHSITNKLKQFLTQVVWIHPWYTTEVFILSRHFKLVSCIKTWRRRDKGIFQEVRRKIKNEEQAKKVVIRNLNDTKTEAAEDQHPGYGVDLQVWKVRQSGRFSGRDCEFKKTHGSGRFPEGSRKISRKSKNT